MRVRGMDYDTRETYRAAVAEFAANSNCTEQEVARKAIALARLAQQTLFSSGGQKRDGRMSAIIWWMPGRPY